MSLETTVQEEDALDAPTVSVEKLGEQGDSIAFAIRGATTQARLLFHKHFLAAEARMPRCDYLGNNHEQIRIEISLPKHDSHTRSLLALIRQS